MSRAAAWFFRETLKRRDVDVVVGVPAHSDMALTTLSYYRSSYMFVTRKGPPPNSVPTTTPHHASLPKSAEQPK